MERMSIKYCPRRNGKVNIECMVLDADNILLSDTVERFVSLFLEK